MLLLFFVTHLEVRRDIPLPLQEEHLVPVQLWEPAIRFFTLLCAAAAIVVHNRRGVFSSGLMWTFWCLYTCTSALLVAHYITNLDSASLRVPVAGGEPSFFASVVLLALNFLLTFWSERHTKTPPEGYQAPTDQEKTAPAVSSDGGVPDPVREASFPSKLTFAWFTELAWQGFRRNLSTDDLWELNPSSSCKEVSKKFEANLHREPKKPKNKNVYISAASGDAANAMEMKEVPEASEKAAPETKVL